MSAPPPAMHHRLASLASLLALGCASTLHPDPASSTDAATPVDASVATAPDGARCPPRTELPAAPACAGLTELAEHRVADAVDTYALDDLRPAADASRPATTAEPWQDRADTTVRFTAPRGGRWRLTATGDELWSLDVRRGCDAPAGATGYPDVHGPFARGAHTLDVQVQRGESIAVALDGCPAGADCRYALRAQRIGELACEFAPGTAPVCAGEREACAVDPCDPEHFACLAVARREPVITSLRVLGDGDRPRTLYLGRARLGDTSITARSPALMARWIDASGTTLSMTSYVGIVRVAPDGSFTGLAGAVPRGAVRGRFWFYSGNGEETDALDATVEPWTAAPEGAPCGPSLPDRCNTGLRCAAADPAATGVCRRADSLAVTRLRAWRDDLVGSLRVSVDGVTAGASVSQLSLTVLDAGGATLASAPTVTPMVSVEQPAEVGFATGFEVSNDVTVYRPAGVDRALRVTPAFARVRVAVVDTAGRRSDPVEVAVALTTAAALGAACDDPAVACAAGSTCVQQADGSGRRCEPATPVRTCWLRDTTPTWAPPGGGRNYALEGAAHAIGGGTRCYPGRTQRTTSIEFVAPVAGRYVFTARGMRSIEVSTDCEAPTCVLTPPGNDTPQVVVTLSAGQHAPITLASDTTGFERAPFTLDVRAP